MSDHRKAFLYICLWLVIMGSWIIAARIIIGPCKCPQCEMRRSPLVPVSP